MPNQAANKLAHPVGSGDRLSVVAGSVILGALAGDRVEVLSVSGHDVAIRRTIGLSTTRDLVLRVADVRRLSERTFWLSSPSDPGARIRVQRG